MSLVSSGLRPKKKKNPYQNMHKRRNSEKLVLPDYISPP